MRQITPPTFHVETFSETWKSSRILVSCRCVIGRDHDYAEWQLVVRGRTVEQPGHAHENLLP